MGQVAPIEVNGKKVKRLTKKQRDLFEFCLNYLSEHHHMPTLKTAAAHFGLQPNAIYEQMRWIERKGWIERSADSNRYRLAVAVIKIDGLEELKKALKKIAA